MANAIISIHVPAKGTTGQKPVSSVSLTLFQSTFPRRERRQNKQFPPSIFRDFHLNIRTPCLHCALFSLFHLQTYSFCAFFLVRISQHFYVCLSSAPQLHNKNSIHRNSSVYTNMFYFCFILISQIIKSQTIYFFINNIC